MVYCGKPSKGCENCRTKKICLGYRDQMDLMFRDENTRTQARFRQWHARTCGSASISASNASSSLLFAADSYVMQVNCATPAFSLSPPTEDVVINHFYHTILDNLSDEDPVRYLHSQLPNLYASCDPGSALRLATEAISYAASRKLVQKAALLCRKRYVQAIKAIGQAIQDPTKVGNDQTLYAILLLCGYETMLRDPSTTLAWGAHVDGAAALVKFRGISEAHSSLSRSMFWFVRRNLVLGHMQLCKPVDDVFSVLDMLAPSQESPEYHLISKAAEIPNLQYRSNCMFIQPQDAIKNDVENLFHSARALDREILDWARTVPTTWSYTAAMNANDLASSDFTPRQVHRYPNIYIARVWNFYRVSRLIIQSLLTRAISWMSTSMDLNDFDEGGQIEKSSMELVNDICASVPFLLGYDLTKMKLPSTSGGSKQERTSRSGIEKNGPARNGRFSLIWPLHISCSSSSVPQAQRDWMRMQLRFLANCGEKQAQVVCFTRSQILLGGIDHDRFDCV
ncbi:c6 zinc finger protein [Colletotrichum incanum]|uniref:C6 zinc finger protein n=1 Tax=Colletotrichum incanum TaxID=1573173 RepID=A0A167AWF2_COLIC|nr:c6 zinc finger protein [Colletotrichum incanum]OHW95111.1 C6 zinc finger domain-containing protein [Colletotrichum incanum]